VSEYLEFEQVQARLVYLKGFMKWREIVALPDFRRIAIGTLSNALYGREPKDPITRARLHLCPQSECGQCWRFNKYIKRAAHQPTRWADMSAETIRVAFQYREEI